MPPKIAPTAVDHWKPKLKLTQKGWRVRIWSGHDRSKWYLFQGTLQEAARAARDQWMRVRADVDDYPEAGVTPTFEDWIQRVRAAKILRPETLFDYQRRLESLLRAVGLDSSATLTDMRPDQVTQYLDIRSAKGATVAQRRSAANSAATLVRCARALFSKRIRRVLGYTGSSPFDGVDVPSLKIGRHVARVPFKGLFAAAGDKLGLEEMTIFMLAAFAGLRRGEIDRLKWADIDWDRKTLLVSEGKSEWSMAEVDLSDDLVDFLRQWRKALGDPVYVVPGKATNRYRPRISAPARKLAIWLRSKGVNVSCPIHYLRKEYGSMINARHGIHAASVALRHGGLAVTTKHYVSKPGRLAIGPSDL